MTNTNPIDTAAVLACFKGKALENARAALEAVEASRVQGSWIKGVSRSARAALDKTNLMKPAASKALRKIGASFDYHLIGKNGRISGPNPAKHAANAVEHVLCFGPLRSAVDVSALDADKRYTEALAIYRRVMAAFGPLVALLARLDATRPKPVFTALGASPTVTATIKMLDAVKVDVCPIEWIELERKNPKGETYFVTVGRLLWPAGTKHGTSRFTCDKAQCEACGHGIRNPFNWVPLALTSTDGTPRSLWVGRDCSRTLFGIDLEGELELLEGPGAAAT